MSHRASFDPAQPVPPPDGDADRAAPPAPSSEQPTYGFVAPQETGQRRGVKIALIVIAVVLLALLVALATLVVGLVRGLGTVGSDLWDTARSELSGQPAGDGVSGDEVAIGALGR